jgi:putative ABC transport system ATP-binding protein
MSALELRDVSKVYGEGVDTVHALRSVSLCVEAGELVAVMGPSGSGKSTLLTAGLTAAENVALPLELDGVPGRRARIEGLRALEDLGLGDRADHFPDQLSGGERQRVAIARAIVGQRRVLLTDEPTGALDSINGEAVLRLLRKACERGVAGMMVTHDAQLASWADRVVFLRDGRMVDQTRPPTGPESLLDNP